MKSIIHVFLFQALRSLGTLGTFIYFATFKNYTL